VNSRLNPAPTLVGEQVVLHRLAPEHTPVLRRLRGLPEVWSRWGPSDPAWPEEDTDEVRYAVHHGEPIVGLIQYGEEPDPMYRHASIDIFLDPAVHSRGLGRDAVRTLVRHLIEERRHHRLVIDPAADNAPAISCYRAVGFQVVGRMARYERDADGAGWHDGLLMELVIDERPTDPEGDRAS
jgi:RimJ/RimL family protein N-acetyltransferase